MTLTIYSLALDTAEDGTRGYVFRTEKEAWTQLVQSLGLTQDPTCIACLEHGEYEDLDTYLEDITESHSTWSIDSHTLDLEAGTGNAKARTSEQARHQWQHWQRTSR